MNAAEYLEKIGSDITGLNDKEVKLLKKQFPANTPPGLTNISPLMILLRQFNSPLIFILILISIFSLLMGETNDGLIIIFMLTINVSIGYLQELKAEKSLNKLKKLLVFNCKVLRNGVLVQIPTVELVPGDVVKVNMGDTIPADLLISDCSRLEVDESALTGESLPVQKNAARNEGKELIPQKIKNGLFMGTSVVAGSATGVVVYTGKDTFIGQSVTHSALEVATNFEQSLSKFSKMLLIFVVTLSTLIFIVNLILGRDPIISFMFGITLALGITPETLPIIITIAIATSALQLSHKGVLVRRLSAIEDLGNMDIFCSDKTGTITKGDLKMVDLKSLDGSTTELLQEYALLCNSYNPLTQSKLFKNPIDKAIFDHIEKAVHHRANDSVTLLDYVDFDFQHKQMQVLIRKRDTRILIIKGAFDSIIGLCNSKVSDQELDAAGKKELIAQNSDYEKKGYRVLALAFKEFDQERIPIDPAGLRFLGFLVFHDPPKQDLKQTFAKLKNLNIDLKIISGDGPEITREICEQAGLRVQNNKVVTSNDIMNATKQEKLQLILNHNVFARITPVEKQDIITILKEQGHAVGYFGDGINDVGALKAADIAVSVQHGSDVAKDCADLILLKNDLPVLVDSVIEGRRTFSNTIKFITNTMSSSYGNVLTIAIASFFMRFIPLLPVQVLFIDTLSDFQHLTISTDNVDKELLNKPRKWDSKFFVKFMLFFGVISTVFDLALISILLGMGIGMSLFRTLWVVESIITELIATFSVRTKNLFWKSRPSKYVLLTSTISSIIALAIPFTLFGATFFEFVPFSLQMGSIILMIIITYFLMLELGKWFFYKHVYKI